MPECYIRGSTIKYLRLPDEVIDLVKEEVIARGRGRGENRGRGGPGRGRGGPGRGLFQNIFLCHILVIVCRINDFCTGGHQAFWLFGNRFLWL